MLWALVVIAAGFVVWALYYVWNMPNRKEDVSNHPNILAIKNFVLTEQGLADINVERIKTGRSPLSFEKAYEVAKWRANLSPEVLCKSTPGGDPNSLDVTERYLVYYEPLQKTDLSKFGLNEEKLFL